MEIENKIKYKPTKTNKATTNKTRLTLLRLNVDGSAAIFSLSLSLSSVLSPFFYFLFFLSCCLFLTAAAAASPFLVIEVLMALPLITDFNQIFLAISFPSFISWFVVSEGITYLLQVFELLIARCVCCFYVQGSASLQAAPTHYKERFVSLELRKIKESRLHLWPIVCVLFTYQGDIL